MPEGQVPYRNSSKRREIQRLGQVFEHLSAESFARNILCMLKFR